MRRAVSIRLRGLSAGCALVVALAGCSSSIVISDLPPMGKAVSRSAAWQVRLGGSRLATFLEPAVQGGAVYAASAAGVVVRIDAASGREVWRRDLGVTISGGVGTGAGLVVVGTSTGLVIALGEDGSERWRAAVSSEVRGAPLVHDDLVAVRTVDARIAGLDGRTGERRWVFQRAALPLVVRGYSALAMSGPTLFAGLAGGRVAALASVNGNARWESAVATPRGTNEIERMSDVIGKPFIGRGDVCAVTYQGRAGCFSMETGNALWSREVSSASGLGGDARFLFVTDDRSRVLALDRGDGSVAWRQDALAGRQMSAPAALGQEVVLGDVRGYVHFLSRDEGQLVARAETDGDPIDVPPINTPAGVIVQTRGGLIAAFAIAR
jgi:outer membrane protein assembly factor BamB